MWSGQFELKDKTRRREGAKAQRVVELYRDKGAQFGHICCSLVSDWAIRFGT
jgi:hypothetical protein